MGFYFRHDLGQNARGDCQWLAAPLSTVASLDSEFHHSRDQLMVLDN